MLPSSVGIVPEKLLLYITLRGFAARKSPT
jgi:hypothetical protein